MELKCPKCSKPLPEVETLEYRFCPRCGAEISAKPEKLDEAFQTIPPDLPVQQPDQTPKGLDSETGQKEIFTKKFDDKTIAPQPMAGLKPPELKPPDTPPPSSFYRIHSAEKTQAITPKEQVPPGKVIKRPSATKNRNIIIATVVILAVIILVLGGLFTF
jgi:DNA-directed RNA polymerase subunit RPC12/RpoP